MIASFDPSTARAMPARGVTAAPPCKSLAHRLLIAAGLSAGESRVDNVDLSDDICATLDCLQALGAEVETVGDAVRLRGVDVKSSSTRDELPCRECGSSLRFFIPLCLLGPGPTRLRGSRRLFSRPLGVYEQICAQQGLTFVKEAESLSVQGPLQGGDFTVTTVESSQFVSGLLFALPLLPQDSRISLPSPLLGRPYIDLTLQALSCFGVAAHWEDQHTIIIPGGQAYRPASVTVEGDYGNAAVFQALNSLGGQVTVTGLDPHSLQGDRIAGEYFRKLEQGQTCLDISDTPDLGPLLLALAAAAHGVTLTGTARLRFKESDRIAAMQEELGKFGARMEAKENSVFVYPAALHRPAEMLDGHNDHRIVMALSLLAAKYGGSIRGAEAVAKSLPDFFERLRYLGLAVELTK